MLVSCGVVVVVMLEGGGNNGAREVKGAHLIRGDTTTKRPKLFPR